MTSSTTWRVWCRYCRRYIVTVSSREQAYEAGVGHYLERHDEGVRGAAGGQHEGVAQAARVRPGA